MSMIQEKQELQWPNIIEDNDIGKYEGILYEKNVQAAS